MSQTSTDERKQEATNVNHQLKMGILPLLSGYLCQEVLSTQQLHMNNLKLHRKPNIHSWNRGVIRALLDYSQSVWKFRSDILHNESTFTQETMLREQAVKLLFSLRSTPFRLPQKSHTLLLRTKEYIQTTHLRNIISWTKRVDRALEEQNFNGRTTSNDIRTWLYSGAIVSREACRRLRDDEDTWYGPHNYDTDDSDMTVNFYRKYPDERDSTWTPRMTPLISSASTSTLSNCQTNVPNILIAPKWWSRWTILPS